MTRSHWLCVLAALGVPLAVWGYDRSHWMLGVGSTRLEVEFLVTDASDGHPIPGATVEVRPVESDGCDLPSGPDRFRLVTDGRGEARKTRDVLVTSAVSGLGVTSTSSIRAPYWEAVVSAPAFVPSDAVLVWRHSSRPRRVGPGAARLLIRVPLRRAA